MLLTYVDSAGVKSENKYDLRLASPPHTMSGNIPMSNACDNRLWRQDQKGEPSVDCWWNIRSRLSLPMRVRVMNE